MFSTASNIRVFVQWSEQTVFAGENVECQITFKNVATTPNIPKPSTLSDDFNEVNSGTKEQKLIPLQNRGAQGKNYVSQDAQAGASNRGHRSTLSFNASVDSVRSNHTRRTRNTMHVKAAEEQRSHKRSLSIISLKLADCPGDELKTPGNAAENFQRPPRGHTRASSLQIVPRHSGINGVGPPFVASSSYRSVTQPVSSSNAAQNVEDVTSLSEIALYNKPTFGRNFSIVPFADTPSIHKVPNHRRKISTSFPQNFKFPASNLTVGDQFSPDRNGQDDEGLSPRTTYSPTKVVSPRSKDDIPTFNEQTSTLSRIMSPIMNGETPRSSGEFYALSNNSTETLASEYLQHQLGRNKQRGAHVHRVSNFSAINQPKAPETLMMGYAQVHGSFTLDGSLVNQAPFEEVKRKSVLGGQGGGVVGVETSKRDSKLHGGFSWGAIGESLSSLLSSGELSSIKDMQGIAGSKSIPLLSTPQSILFVDLQLAPGESRSYNYTFKLPRGLPPSHRGKAIKIFYSLVIGIQRPGGPKEQQIRSVEIPFRILGSVNDHGELLGHDLMSPYIILRDQSLVHSLDNAMPNSITNMVGSKFMKATTPMQSSQDDFLAYVDDLITKPRQNSSLGLLSPTETRATRRQSSVAESSSSSAKEAIDLAILRSNLATNSKHSANRFEISRSGRRVAVVMLTRPAYRLGETISAAIDFTGAIIPCYALHASLETSEKVDGVIALRSDASIHRVTRKIYSSHSEATLFADRIVFTPTIPSTATPTFITSGVSLDWKIVIEFVTPRSEAIEDNMIMQSPELLQEISWDDRGAILAAAEVVECETFEVLVPIQVYGALVGVVEEDEIKGIAV